jgi:hypothetical protein
MSLQDWPEPVGADMIDNVLGKDVDGLEPAGLQREGLGGASQYKPREIKSFPSRQLAQGQTQELQRGLLAAGIPL